MAKLFDNLPFNPEDPTRYKDRLIEKLNLSEFTNLADPAFTRGVNNINLMDMYGGLRGFVESKKPQTVNMSPYGNKVAQVLAHEAAHTQDILANNRRPNLSQLTASQFSEAKGKKEEGSKLKDQLISNYKKYIEEYLKANGEINAEKDIGTYYYNKNAQYDERLADLQSLEAMLPKGQTLLDTPLGKQILNTPELQNYWRQTVTPLESKAIPNLSNYEKPFWLKALERAQLAGDVFQQETRANKSYADSAIEALKVLSPFYQDPFKDTTR